MAQDWNFDFERWRENLQEKPVNCLNRRSRTILSQALNYTAPVMQMITSSDCFTPDWKGLAEALGFGYQESKNLENSKDPTGEVLEAWSMRPRAHLDTLMITILKLGRYDILENEVFRECIDRDVENYLKNLYADRQTGQLPIQVPQVASSTSYIPRLPPVTGDFPVSAEEEMLVDETAHVTTENIIYDAFISYAVEDWWFVKELMENLETSEYGIKLCIDVRNLLAGGHEGTITAEVLQNRCRRVLVVVSRSYIRSPSCDFEYKFTQSLSPGFRSKKMIPIVIEKVDPKSLPPIMKPVSMLHYVSCGVDSAPHQNTKWFWYRLAQSIKAPIVMSDNSDLSQVTMEVSGMPDPKCLLNTVSRATPQPPTGTVRRSSESKVRKMVQEDQDSSSSYEPPCSSSQPSLMVSCSDSGDPISLSSSSSVSMEPSNVGSIPVPCTSSGSFSTPCQVNQGASSSCVSEDVTSVPTNSPTSLNKYSHSCEDFHLVKADELATDASSMDTISDSGDIKPKRKSGFSLMNFLKRKKDKTPGNQKSDEGMDS